MSAMTVPPLDPPSPLLYGRDGEYARLLDWLGEAVEGRGRLVVVGGEAGIGKTALVDAFATDARSLGADVLVGACYDAAQSPFGLWADLARRSRPGDGPFPLPALDGDRITLRQAGEQGGHTGDVIDYIDGLASRRPLVLILEDLHWADQASLHLLRAIARSLSSMRALVIATYRDADLTPADPLYLLLPEIVRETHAERVSLRRLSAEDVQALTADRYELPDEEQRVLTSWLQTFAEGNPFFIHELLHTLEYESVLHVDGGWKLGDLSAVVVPGLVQQVIDAQLARLEPETVSHLQVAAVIGNEIPYDPWQLATEATDDSLATTIEQALQSRLLVELVSEGGFRFRHALIREALYNSLVLPRRRTWHRRIAEALEALPHSDPDAVAHHFRQAGDRRAVAWLQQAADRAIRQFAWPMAAERLLAAAELLADDPNSTRQRAWLLYHAGKLSRRADPRRGIECLEESRRLADELSDTLLLGIATADLGLLLCINMEIARGLDVIGAGVEILDAIPEGAEQAADALAEKQDVPFVELVPHPSSRYAARINWLAAAGRFEEAIEEGTAFVARIPNRPPDPRYEDAYDAYIGLGRSWSMLGMPVEARAAFDAARSGYTALERMPGIYYLDEIRHVIAYHFDDANARKQVDELVTYVRSRNRSIELAEGRRGAFFGSHRLLLFEGRWDDLEEILRSTLATVPTSPSAFSAALLLSDLNRRRGDIAAARRHLQYLMDEYKFTSYGDTWYAGAIAAQVQAADTALDAGDYEDARSWLDMLRDWLERSGSVIGRVEYHLASARYASLTGDVALAREHADRALEVSTNPRLPLGQLWSRRALARFDIESERFAEAREHLDAAIALAEACGAPFERALCLLAQAELGAATGNAAEARQHLNAARSTLAPLRAAPALAEADALEQRLTEDRPARRERSSPLPGGLSARELDVLRLVARGLTDNEIAAQLHISPRTVSGHLQSIFNKLGVSSRTAAAAFAFEHDLL